jgi:hypothetical protein
LFLLPFHALPSHAFLHDRKISIAIEHLGCIKWRPKKLGYHPTYPHHRITTEILWSTKR